jgi:hypothetical protein
MEPPRLFLETLAELDMRLSSQDEYDVLAISRILRLLLDDEQPLVHQVNRVHRLLLRFNCTRSYIFRLPASLQPDTLTVQDGFDPETSIPGNERIEVDLQGLLSEVVAVHNGRRLSVLDVIKYEAHVEGGVHAGTPRDEQAAILKGLNASLRVGGYTPTLRQLKPIGRVVLRGLHELAQRVREANG